MLNDRSCSQIPKKYYIFFLSTIRINLFRFILIVLFSFPLVFFLFLCYFFNSIFWYYIIFNKPLESINYSASPEYFWIYLHVYYVMKNLLKNTIGVRRNNSIQNIYRFLYWLSVAYCSLKTRQTYWNIKLFLHMFVLPYSTSSTTAVTVCIFFL